MPSRSRLILSLRSHFVLCTFLGVLVLERFGAAFGGIRGTTDALHIVVGSLVAGLLTAGATWTIHWAWVGRLRRKILGDAAAADSRRLRREGTRIGFVCGALCVFYAIELHLLVPLSLVFLFLIVGYARHFLVRVSVMLRPGNHPRVEDAAELAFLYATLIASCTVLNTAIQHGNVWLADGETAFRGLGPEARFGDLLYFSIVVITTLGFGDITPATPFARFVVSVEVLTGYLLFALLIGTLTRGILPRGAPPDSSGDSPKEDPPDSR